MNSENDIRKLLKGDKKAKKEKAASHVFFLFLKILKFEF